MLCVRVAAVRTYKNAKGEGRVGSIDMMDGSGDIKGTFFNDDCDKWMSTLMVNTVYKIRGGMIKPANAQFNNCSSQVEITFGRDTVFEPLRYPLSKGEMLVSLPQDCFLAHTHTHKHSVCFKSIPLYLNAHI